ncbi:MAG TPA: hypothetical protein PLP34_01495, partial [Chitinophagaceae bacterium]|nr:hypothetical protein [Chitinophagaceae bacterium]
MFKYLFLVVCIGLIVTNSMAQSLVKTDSLKLVRQLRLDSVKKQQQFRRDSLEQVRKQREAKEKMARKKKKEQDLEEFSQTDFTHADTLRA